MATTVYHIYHSGDKGNCYSVHLVSDLNTTLNIKDEIAAQPQPEKSSDPKATENEDPTSHRSSTWSTLKIRRKRRKAYDQPIYDPRTQTAPYFLHGPVL